MFAELITRFAPVMVAVVLLIPLVAFLAMMLFEGAGRGRWGRIRRATRNAFVSPPLRLPLRRQSH